MARSLLAVILLASLSQLCVAQSAGGPSLNDPVRVPETTDLLAEGKSDARQGQVPFGANLFGGGFRNDRENGLNRDYVLQPGDRLTVRIWGAAQFAEQLTIDPQGNIFIPSVGPIQLAGVRNKDLNDRVETAVDAVYTDNVRVYANLDNSQPVAVFVTGFVPQPGRFAGIPSHSALYFLDQAGGVDPVQGSYRNITVMRDGALLSEIDLYEFLLNGHISDVQFRDGDTIVVGPRGSVVEASGDIGSPARYELSNATVSGDSFLALVQPRPDVSFVGISGIRQGQATSLYVPVDEFRSMTLGDGDRVHFRADQRDTTIIVDVEGSHLGPSRFALPSNTRLHDLLDYIPIDPELADSDAISLKRLAIAKRQKQSLEESLQRLEAQYLTASSQTDRESSIRTQEAELIGAFVQRAREVRPNGRLVVSSDGEIANVLLRSGDTVSIPRRSESVLISGEVFVTQAVLYEPGAKARDYIARSGGFTRRAEQQRLVVVHANGEVTSGSDPIVRPGDEVIVLPKVPVKNLQIAATLVDIIYKIAVAASVAVQL